MTIGINLAEAPEKFTSRHWMFVPLPKGLPEYRAFFSGHVTVSGVVATDVAADRAGGATRERVELDLATDLDNAVRRAPWPAPAGVELFQWTVFAAVSSFQRGTGNGFTAVDSFGLLREPLTIYVDTAVSGAGAHILRVAYQVQVLVGFKNVEHEEIYYDEHGGVHAPGEFT